MIIWASWTALFSSLLIILGQSSWVVSQDVGMFDGVVFETTRRQLRAATSVKKLAKREANVLFYNELELNYIEDHGEASLPPLSASVIFQMKLPSLLLEDVEHMIEGIHCESDSMELSFGSSAQMEMFRDALATYKEFMIVTSHASCNDEHSRLPYLVRSSSCSNQTTRISLAIELLGWKDTMTSMTTKFDRVTSYDLRSPQHFQRQRVVKMPVKRGIGDDIFGSATISSVAVSVTTQGTLTSLPFPTPTLTPSPTATSVADGADSSKTGIILDPSTPPSAQSGGDGTAVPPSVSCINCNTGGSLQISSGSLTVATQNQTSQNETVKAIQFLQYGYAEIIASGLSAHVELNTSWPASNASHDLSVELARIPLSPYTIPGIGVIGPFFNPQLVFSASVLSPVSFQYGFEISVPNDTLMQVHFGNITASVINGLENTNFSMLPFQSSTPNLSFSVSTTFQPVILLGFSFFEGVGLAGAGVFMNLPTLAMTVSQVANADTKCNPVTSNPITGNLTRVEPEVQIVGGFIAEAEIGHDIRKLSEQTSYNVFSRNFSAPTQCLRFDQGKSTYAPAGTSTSDAAISGASVNAMMVTTLGTALGMAFLL